MKKNLVVYGVYPNTAKRIRDKANITYTKRLVSDFQFFRKIQNDTDMIRENKSGPLFGNLNT